jgi:DNA replication protein DnaC
MLTTLAKTDWLILDDLGLAPLSADNRHDVLEIIVDRHDGRAPLGTRQLPVEHWHEALGEPTLADPILDRLVPNASKITLQGASLRKQQAQLTRGVIAEQYSTVQRRCAPRVTE